MESLWNNVLLFSWFWLTTFSRISFIPSDASLPSISLIVELMMEPLIYVSSPFLSAGCDFSVSIMVHVQVNWMYSEHSNWIPLSLGDTPLWKDAMARMESIELRTVWADTPNRLPFILVSLSNCPFDTEWLFKIIAKKISSELDIGQSGAVYTDEIHL